MLYKVLRKLLPEFVVYCPTGSAYAYKFVISFRDGLPIWSQDIPNMQAASIPVSTKKRNRNSKNPSGHPGSSQPGRLLGCHGLAVVALGWLLCTLVCDRVPVWPTAYSLPGSYWVGSVLVAWSLFWFSWECEIIFIPDKDELFTAPAGHPSCLKQVL